MSPGFQQNIGTDHSKQKKIRERLIWAQKYVLAYNLQKLIPKRHGPKKAIPISRDGLSL
jgi:hypothetical protein